MTIAVTEFIALAVDVSKLAAPDLVRVPRRRVSLALPAMVFARSGPGTDLTQGRGHSDVISGPRMGWVTLILAMLQSAATDPDVGQSRSRAPRAAICKARLSAGSVGLLPVSVSILARR